jgi:beta-lactamase regulating signal transducer with metallopeptidase domain
VLWLVVLAKCVTPPIVSSPWGIFCWMQATDSVTVVRPAAKSTQSVREHAKRLDGDADTVVTRLLSRDGEQAAFDRRPRSDPLLADREEVVLRQYSTRAALMACVFAGWVMGCALFIVVTIARVRSCWRKLEVAGEIEAPAVFTLLEGIRRRFGLRRTVRLWVTPISIGPAVIGIWHPTIILPAALVNGKTPSKLEPLLAHELMHIRRGDLWTGLLQTLAVGLWWFHPLVRLVSRLLTREAERCCDEQVIAHLHYQPRVYAQSLIDVLTLKQKLQPVPVCPGVRPIDVTSQRLERIMRLGHGSHKHTPWWCWAAMLLLAITALPGAALLARRQARSTTPSEALWGNLQIRAGDFVRLRRESFQRMEEEPDESLTTRTLDVSDLVSEIREYHVESDEMAREFLVHLLRYFVHGPRESGEGFEGNPAKPSITWSEGKLVVRHTESGHEWIDRQLAILRQHGYAQLCVEVRVLSGPAAILQAAHADWQLIGGTTPEDDSNGDMYLGGQTMPVPPRRNSSRAGISGTVESVVERQLPAMVALIDDAQVRQLVQAAQDHPVTSIVFAPKITVFNGQTARIEDGVERPFVVGVKPAGEGKYEPQIRLVAEGKTIRLRPELHRDQRLHLDVGVTVSSVKDVETAQFPVGEGKQPIAVQVPEVTTMRVQSSVEMELGKSLAISIPATKSDKKGTPSCILVRVYHVEEPFLSAAAASPAGDAQGVTKKPSRPGFAMGQVVARVGKQVILYDEIMPTVNLMLELMRTQPYLTAGQMLPESQLEEQLTKEIIHRAIHCKMLRNEFERTMPSELRLDAKKKAEAERKLKRQIHLAFDSALASSREKIASASEEGTVKLLGKEPIVTRLALFMKVNGLHTMPELDAVLRPLGTSLDQQIDEFGETMLGLEAVRNQVGFRNRIARQEAEQEVLSRIRAATTVWTIYDHPS